MLNKFTLSYNKIDIATKRGLVQRSVLSPLLFNLFINDLLIMYEILGIKVRAYADDIAWIWTSDEQLQFAISIINQWCISNKMKINSSKSGLMKILLRKSKCKGISNELNIPEADSYRYLGAIINQTLKFNIHENYLRMFEAKMKRRINILRLNLVSVRSRLTMYK